MQNGSNHCASNTVLDFLHDNSEKESEGVNRRRTFDVMRQPECRETSVEMPERLGFRPARRGGLLGTTIAFGTHVYLKTLCG